MHIFTVNVKIKIINSAVGPVDTHICNSGLFLKGMKIPAGF
jgi:hypothetical protein